MRLRSVRTCLFIAAAALASLVVPAPAQAGGAVVPRTGVSDPTALDVRIAVAATPAGTTRWTEVTTPGSTRALWLVPARPGAAIDWSADGWLAALDEATAPRILPPSAPATCPVPASPERAASWSKTATKRAPAAVVVHVTADAVRSYAAEQGFEVTPALAARIGSLFDAGWDLVSIELASTWSTASSGTLRVSDDGGAVLPLALTGSRAASTYVTAFAIGAGVASIPGARDVDASAIRWGQRGSSYAEWRRNVVVGNGGSVWLRESASHGAVFEGTAIPGALPALSVAASYFVNNACASSAQAAGGSAGTVGISCAPGAAARVPGGAGCTPSSGSIDPSAVSCGSADDLALALSGSAPSAAVVTRWAGLVPRGSLGGDLPITFAPAAAERRPVIRAAAYEACTAPTEDPPLTPPPSSSSSSTGGGGGGLGSAGSGGGGGAYVESGCGGSTTTASTTYYEEEGDPPPDEGTSDSCSGGTETTSSSSDGWDDSDSGDSCSGGDDTSSSSSSSDSCSGGSSSSSSSSGGSDDGWDTDDEASPQGVKVKPAAKKPHAVNKTKKKKPASPVSRYALLAVALLLPLRRRGRVQL